MFEALELYRSSKRRRWSLDAVSGRVFVKHEADISSGGQVSEIRLGDFLSAGFGPEQETSCG